MSEMSAVARVARVVAAPTLRSVPAPVRAVTHVPFLVMVTATLLVGIVGLLVFNTNMQQASFAATALNAQAESLTAREQTLRLELDRLRDPQRVAAEASALGMVPAPSTGILHLPDGRVEGTPRPATPEDGIRLGPLAPVKPDVLSPAPVRRQVLPPDVPVAETRGDRTDRPGGAEGTAQRGAEEQGRAQGRQNRPPDQQRNRRSR